MPSLIYAMKESASVLNVFLLLLLAAWIFYRFQKKKTAKFIVVSVLFLLILTATNYLPHYLAKNLEKQNPPLSISAIKNIRGKVYIHVLGSGYTPNKNIPPNAQIGLAALGRLAEAIRVYRLLDSAVIVCSGNGPVGAIESQAEVTKNAAVVLGIPPGNLGMLNTPSTTIEEAEALAQQYGKNIRVIIATDAIHMPRAIRFFKAAGFVNPLAAPTNFKAGESTEDNSLKWLPSMSNVALTNQVLHEYLGDIKAALW
jgi:uncharacterized SAM-binding protein YcdF (DUF218 family)